TGVTATPAAVSAILSSAAANSGARTTCATSSAILSMISGGVRAGANSAYHDETVKPGRPASAKVGRSGAHGTRFSDATASARSLPARTSGSPTLADG